MTIFCPVQIGHYGTDCWTVVPSALVRKEYHALDNFAVAGFEIALVQVD